MSQLPPPPASPWSRARLRQLLNTIRVILLRMATENIRLKTMSFGLAVAIWALLQSEQVVERRTRVKVQYSWPEELVRVDEVPRWVSVTVSGPQGRVRAVERRSLQMKVDLTEAERGLVPIDFTELRVNGLPDSLKITQINPPMAEVELDAKVRQKVHVRPSVIGEPVEGWSRGTITVAPQSIEVEGPASLLRELTEVSTEIVNISGTKETVEADVGLSLPTRIIKPTVEAPVHVRVAVEALMDNRTFTDVPVFVPNGWAVDPPTARYVTVYGPIREVTAIRSDKVSVMVTIPDDQKLEQQVLRWQRNDPESPLAVVNLGPSDQIRVEEMGPTRFTLRPLDAPVPTPE